MTCQEAPNTLIYMQIARKWDGRCYQNPKAFAGPNGKLDL
jgi:hypothetical protein